MVTAKWTDKCPRAVVMGAVALLGMASSASAFSAGLAPVIPTPRAAIHSCSPTAAPLLLPLRTAEPRARSAKLVVMAAKKVLPRFGPVHVLHGDPHRAVRRVSLLDANSADSRW